MKNPLFKYIIVLFAVVAFIVLIGIVIARQAGKNGYPTVSNVPGYALTPTQEQNIRVFVKNIVELYNSYQSGEYNGAKSTSDYMTDSFAQANGSRLDTIESYADNNPLEVDTVLDEGSFTYTYPQADTLETSFTGNVTETTPAGKNAYPIAVAAELKKVNDKWLVNNIAITQK
jgi:hypothetical protein